MFTFSTIESFTLILILYVHYFLIFSYVKYQKIKYCLSVSNEKINIVIAPEEVSVGVF